MTSQLRDTCSRSYLIVLRVMRVNSNEVDHTTIYRWVQHYAPELEQRCKSHLKVTNDSWKVDERYIKVRKTWMYLYRAVDSDEKTLEFLLSPTRNAEAAKRFFVKALHSIGYSVPQAPMLEEPMALPPIAADLKVSRSTPRVINVDKHAAYPKAIADLKATGLQVQGVEKRHVTDQISFIASLFGEAA